MQEVNMDNICIGTVQFGLNYGISNLLGIPDKKEVQKIIRIAHQNDISFYDTAQSYGDSEKVLGESFEKLGISKDVNIVSKLHPDFHFDSSTSFTNAMENSLTKLKITSLWGMLMSRSEIKGDWKRFLLSISKEKENGRLKNFGVTIYTPEDAMRFANEPSIDIIQIPCNIIDRRFIDIDFFNLAEKKGKQVFIRSAFLQGLFLMNDEQLIKKEMEWAIPHLFNIRKFVNKHNIEIKDFALNGVIKAFPNAKIIIGIASSSQLDENIKTIKHTSVLPSLINYWWQNLPEYPGRLLNPSLW